MSTTISQEYAKDGFCFTSPIYDACRISAVNEAVAAVLHGEYETGVPPFHAHDPAHLTQALVKIDNAQLANRQILSFLSDSEFGRLAAEVTGARRVQIWATQLLVKRPTSKQAAGGVGWHRDETYWGYWTPDSELFTAWIALSDVGRESGPVCMVPGSHLWPESQGGDFFSGNLDSLKTAFAPPTGDAWQEVPMTLEPGAISFHHKRTIHGSYPNSSTRERLSFAVHLCTENARVRPDVVENPYIDSLDDPLHSPIIWEE